MTTPSDIQRFLNGEPGFKSNYDCYVWLMWRWHNTDDDDEKEESELQTEVAEQGLLLTQEECDLFQATYPDPSMIPDTIPKPYEGH